MAEIAELFITDGTHYIDLLNHFRLGGWRPTAIPYKDGGIMQSSPIGDRQRLVLRHYDNQGEQMSLILKAGHQKGAINDLRRLRAILELAADYQTGWSTTIVYIAARSIGENNLRYAIIVRGMVPEDPDPYAPPFNRDADGGSLGQVDLQIEHWPWQGNIPTQSTAVEVAAYDGVAGFLHEVGTVDASGTITPNTNILTLVGNKDNASNITDIYYDDGGGGFSANLALQSPFVTTPLFRAAVAVGESLYFGSDSAQATALGPFNNLAFDIGTARVGFTATTWEYWNGAAWAAIPNLIDGTTGFTLTGYRVVNWPPPADWAATVVNGVTGFWVRVRVTAAPGPITRPTQQNRNIFTVAWGFVEIEADQVEGDLPALMGVKVIERAGMDTQTVIVGLRSYDRGAQFNAYLEYTDSGQIQSAFYFTDEDGLGVTIVDDTTAPTGRCAQFDATLYTTGTISIRLEQLYAMHWRGSYRAYVRVDQTLSTPGNILMRLGRGFLNDDKLLGEWVAPTDMEAWQLVDLGKIDILTEVNENETIGEDYELKLYLEAQGTAPSLASMRLYDLILIPVDEWYVQADASSIQTRLGSGAALDILYIDSITNPKVEVRATYQKSSDFVNAVSTGIQGSWIPITNHYPILQVGKRQRLWFLVTNQATADDYQQALPWSIHAVQVFTVPRYNSMRGTE